MSRVGAVVRFNAASMNRGFGYPWRRDTSRFSYCYFDRDL
jgi:hypothetical protein